MNGEEGNLEKLKKMLYRKELPEERLAEPEFKGRKFGEDVKQEWDEKEKQEPSVTLMSYTRPEKTGMGFMKKFLLTFSLLTLLALGAGAAFVFLKNGNGNAGMDVEISGPVSVGGGEPLAIKIEVINRTASRADSVYLILEYPEGARMKNNPSEKLTRERRDFGSIEAGESSVFLAEMILFGEEGDMKNIKATAEYRLNQSNAVLSENSQYSVKISQSPIELGMNFPAEVRTRQEFSFEVQAKSDSETLLEDVYMQLEYPPGFQFIKSTPNVFTAGKNDLWFLGDLKPGDTKKIIINGLLEGQDLDEKAFKAAVGALDGEELSNIYGTAEKTTVLKKPSFNLSLLINGDDLEKNISSTGENIYCELLWENNLPVKIFDSSIKVNIEGVAVDFGSIGATGGHYRAADNSLVWTKGSYPTLETINPGDNKRARFDFETVENLPISGTSDKNFFIKIKAQISGKRISEEGYGNVEVSSIVEKTIKISSNLQFSGRGLYYSGPFVNSGPVPPMVGKETTYSIVWALTNDANDLAGVKVSSVLPSYVRWTGEVAPSDSAVSYDPQTGEVIWNAGAIKAGTGVSSQAKEIAFKVGLTPSVSQIGQRPDILLGTKVVWYDEFAESAAERAYKSINTELRSDPQMNAGGVVQAAK